MPQGNPFTPFRRSGRLSQFVDESIPAELMLKGIAAKQQQQDDMQALLDKARLWNPETLKGGDAALKERTKAGIKEFGEEWAMKDMTTAKNQSAVKDYLREIATNDRIVQMEKNYQKKVAMEDMITKLKAAGASPFDPSIRQAQRTLEAYEKSMREGEEFDKIDIEKALDLEKKERSYFVGMKDHGSQWFTNSIENLPEGFFGKAGWTGITDKRIEDRAKEVAQDYLNTPEGMQAAAIYRERVLDFKNGLPNGIDPSKESVVDYLGKRILKAGKPLIGGTSTISAQRLPVEKSNDGDGITTNPNDYIVDDGMNIPDPKNTVPKLKEIIANKEGKYSQTQINEAQSDLDKIQISLDNDKEYLAYHKDLKALLTGNSDDPEKNVVYPTAVRINEVLSDEIAEYEGVVSTDGYGTIGEGDMLEDDELKASIDKELGTFMEPVAKWAAENLPGIIQDEILNNNNMELAKSLKRGRLLSFWQTGDFHGVGKPEKIRYGFAIPGTDISFSFDEIGAGTEFTDYLQKNKDGLWSEYGGSQSIAPYTYRKWAIKNALDVIGKQFTTDNVWDLDATDRVVNRVESIRNKQKEYEGTGIITSKTSMPLDDKQRAEMDKLLGDLNKVNYELVSVKDGQLLEMQDAIDDNEEFKNSILAKPSNKDISIRPSLGSRALEITSRTPVYIKGQREFYSTFLLREKKDPEGNVIQQPGFEALYTMGTGDVQGADYVGANDIIRNQTTRSPQKISQLLRGGNVSNVYPSKYDQDLTIRLNPGADAKQSPYILGDKDGDFTQKDIYDYYDNIVAAYRSNIGTTSTKGIRYTEKGLEAIKESMAEMQKKFFVKQALNSKVVTTREAAENLYNWPKEKEGNEAVVNNFMDNQYKDVQDYLNLTQIKAQNLDDIIAYANILSMIK